MLTTLALAKVNLTLDVLDRRIEDGYHYIRSVMVPVDLADTVSLELARDITVECRPDVAGPMEQNLAFRAACLLRQVTGYQGGAAIRISKAIPVAGGLAGGSANGAAVLKGLNALWGTGLHASQLNDLAIQLGSDMPFCLFERPALVEGIGERIKPLNMSTPITMVLATPDVAKSTGNVYRMFDNLAQVIRPRTAEMVGALESGDLHLISAELGNVFEQVMLPRHPEIRELKRMLLDAGCLGALMAGAGPTVFGLVADIPTGNRIRASIREHVRWCSVVQTVAQPSEGKPS